MVPPIARKTAKRFAFEPFWPALPSGPVKKAAFTGFQEVVGELTAEGNLALMQSFENFRPDLGHFAPYARRCVANAITRHAKELRSIVHRPWGRSNTWDLSIDPLKPDVHDTRDYCGSRSRQTTTDADWDDDAEGEGIGGLGGRMFRLRPPASEPQIELGETPRRHRGQWRAGLMTLDHPLRCRDSALTAEERKVIEFRIKGLTLKEIAGDLGVSTATAWRREQAAIDKLRNAA
jgi:RNA polymerase sigma factor (sigma-70 family)